VVKSRDLTTKKQVKTHIDYVLLVIVLMLSIFGIIMVFDSSIKLLTNAYHFVVLQSIWVAIGLGGMVILSRYDYKKLAKLALPLMIFTIVCLIAVLLVGQSENGATRWINLGAFQFQPSEIAKPVIILYLASWFSKEKPAFKKVEEYMRFNFFNELLPFFCLTLLVVGLIIVGRDLGTAIIITATALTLYFIQGSGVVSIMNFIADLGLMAITAVGAIVLEPYRAQRVLTFAKNGSSSSLSAGYQINQILIAIGSGGWIGKGFTQSIQKQQYLVETTAATDSIFAVIAEEFGFIGSLLLFGGYMLLYYRCISIALKTKDSLGKFLVMGIVTWIIIQTLLNIAVNVNLVPLTGVPLPFISYGGSSTIVMLASIGIILNISKQMHGQEN
jgi:cell division protein FtsW